MDDSNLERIIYDTEGRLRKLEIADPAVEVKDFVPDDPRYPNASRYDIVSGSDTGTPGPMVLLFEGREKKERAVVELKRILGIVDPWDDLPDYFNNIAVPGSSIPQFPSDRSTNLPRYFLCIGVLVKLVNESEEITALGYDAASSSFQPRPDLISEILNHENNSLEVTKNWFDETLEEQNIL